MLEGDRGFCSSAEDIAEVQAGTNRHAHETRAGKIREPKDLTSAQFSANWSRALFFVKGGAGYSEYTDDALGDQRILDLSRKIHTDVDDEFEYAWQKTKPRGAGMTVRLRSGETYSECVPNLRPMTRRTSTPSFAASLLWSSKWRRPNGCRRPSAICRTFAIAARSSRCSHVDRRR
jgi:hypothetical protein